MRQLVLATRRQGWRGLVGRANGGMIVHVGVVIIAVAIAANGHFAHEVEARYEPGQTRVISGHEITYLEHRRRAGAEPRGHQGQRPRRRRPGVRAGAVALLGLRFAHRHAIGEDRA